MNNKIKIALTVSVILNFLLAGLLIGNVSKTLFHDKDKYDHFKEMTEKLPGDKQQMVMGRIKSMKEDHKVVKEEIHKTKKEIADILRAPEFDEEMYDKKILEMHNLYRGKARNMANTIKELARDLTPGEREVLAEMIEKKHKKHWRSDKNE